MLDREPTDVEAVEDHAHEDDDRAGEETIGADTILFDREPDNGHDDADENLRPEEQAHSTAGEEKTKFASHSQFTDFEQGVDAESDGKTLGNLFEQVCLKAALEIARTER